MREVIIILIVLIFIISLGVIEQKYLVNTSEELVLQLNELRDELDNLIKNNIKENSEIVKFSENIQNKWDNLDKTWSIIITHSELDQIKLSILEVNSCIKLKEFNKAKKELEKTTFLVEHIKEKQALKIRNLF